jgi:hypothetical protein
VTDDDSAGDLEVISLVPGALAGSTRPKRSVGGGRTRRWVLVGVSAAFLVGLGAGVVLGRRTGSPRSGDAASTPTRPTNATAISPPIQEGALRVLFTHISSTGGVVVARKGQVSTAEARGCSVAVPVRTPVDDPACQNTVADGVQFDFSALGKSWLRLTVLNSDVGTDHESDLQPALTIHSVVRHIGADGSTTPRDGNSSVQITVFHSKAPVATVRVRLIDGGADEMSPIKGWTAFVAEGTSPFGFAVEGIGAHGQLVARTQRQSCC